MKPPISYGWEVSALRTTCRRNDMHTWTAGDGDTLVVEKPGLNAA